MKIKVTQEHIDKGCRFSVYDCPVALALNDVFGPGCSIYCMIHIPGRLSIPAPSDVYGYIRQFDKDTTMIPFEFEINEPTLATET